MTELCDLPGEDRGGLLLSGSGCTLAKDARRKAPGNSGLPAYGYMKGEPLFCNEAAHTNQEVDSRPNEPRNGLAVWP